MKKSELFFWKVTMSVLALVFKVAFGFKAEVVPPSKEAPLGSLIVTNADLSKHTK